MIFSHGESTFWLTVPFSLNIYTPNRKGKTLPLLVRTVTDFMWGFALFWSVWFQYSLGIKNIQFMHLTAWPHAVKSISWSLRHLLIASSCFERVSPATELVLNTDSDLSCSCRCSTVLGTDPKFRPFIWRRRRFALSEALYWIPSLNSECSFSNDYFLCHCQQLWFLVTTTH